MKQSLRRRLRSLESGFRDSRFYLRCGYAIDVLMALAARRHSKHPHPHRNVVLVTAGRGNIGDQAMFESFILNTTAPVTVLLRRRGDFNADAFTERDIDFVEVPALVSGARRGRKKDVRQFLMTLQSAASFSIVGADVMDGGYERGEAVHRSQLLRLADILRVPARVLGFSWNGHSDPVARDELRRASRTAVLFARDPRSAARLASEGISAHQAADIVFQHRQVKRPEAIGEWVDSDPREIVIVNISGLILRKTDLTHEFAHVIDQIVSTGRRVVLLPHVLRPGDDDLVACTSVHALLPQGTDQHVLLVQHTLLPAEVAWLAERSSAVLTGRMHLAILALNRGTVPVTLATQGKVEGLAELFGIDDLVLSPEAGVGEKATERLKAIFDSDEYTTAIMARLPRVRELASISFAGLPSDRMSP